MTIRLYNPEHDMALARWSPFFTPPKAASLTRQRFGYLPALWASDGDWVVVDDVENARAAADADGRVCANVEFVTIKDLKRLTSEQISNLEIDPWGWDLSVCHSIKKTNPNLAAIMPSQQRLEDVRLMSHRRFAADNILPLLVASDSRLVGQSDYVSDTLENVKNHIAMMPKCVVKSPWSCSGRGVRYVDCCPDANTERWIGSVLEQQGGVMIEPLYSKCQDFAMEFMADDEGRVHYLGLSLFTTRQGAYLGNVVDTEENKRNSIGNIVPLELLDIVCEQIVSITSALFKGRYTGPFGIDMMVLQDGKVHPCVEMNLRRTMGHASLVGRN